MRFSVERRPDVLEPTDRTIATGIRALRSYGPHSYASLEDANGNYLQVAGGGVTCMVERYDAATKRRERAFHDRPSPIYPDGTVLAFGGGELRLLSDEWFASDAVVAIFHAFNRKEPLPPSVFWRTTPVIAGDLG